MSSLLATLQGLQAEMRQHPRLHLIQIVSQFDAYRPDNDEDSDFYTDGTEDDEAYYRKAMQNLRRNFPAIYVEVLQMESDGMDYNEIENTIIRRLDEADLEGNDIETLANGWITVPLIGISFYYHESWEHNDTVVNLVHLMDPDAPEDFDMHYEPSQVFGESQFYLLNNLARHVEHPVLSAYYYYFQWFCSSSGNSGIDAHGYDDEGLTPPVWDNPGDIDLAQEINRERRMFEQYMRETELIHFNNPVLWNELRANIARIHQHIAKVGVREKYDDHRPRPRLYWRHAIAHGGAATPDA